MRFKLSQAPNRILTRGKGAFHDGTDPIRLFAPRRQMIAPQNDSIEMEKPQWLAQMEAVLEVLNEGVIIADEHHRMLFANSRFLEMTGIELGKFDPSRFYSSQEWDFLNEHIDVAFRAGHNRYVFFLPRNGGGRMPVIISSRTFQDSGRRFGIVTFTDISEQVRAEKELRSANDKLQARQSEIEEDLRLAARSRKALHPDPWSRTLRASMSSIIPCTRSEGTSLF